MEYGGGVVAAVAQAPSNRVHQCCLIRTPHDNTDTVDYISWAPKEIYVYIYSCDHWLIGSRRGASCTATLA